LAAVIGTAPIAEPARVVLTQRYTSLVGAPLETIAAAWIPSEGIQTDPRYGISLRIKIGNQALAEGMAHQLAHRVHLRQACTSVTYDQAGVTASVASGSEIRADQIVLAIPSPSVAQMSFRPKLSPAKDQAFRQAGMANSKKLAVALAESIEPAIRQATHAPFYGWAVGQADGRATAISSASGGDWAASACDHDISATPWVDGLRQLFPEATVGGYPAVVTDWNRDPWARGAFTNYRIGWSKELDSALSDPERERIFFAGDYSFGDGAIGMERAMRSGIRAAGEVLAAAAS
jgi:monoamine oxidase